MGRAMETKLIQIGNSKGVRFPKSLLQQTGITDRIRIEVVGDRIIIMPANSPRAGWEVTFANDPMVLAQEDHEWLDTKLTDDAGLAQ